LISVSLPGNQLIHSMSQPIFLEVSQGEVLGHSLRDFGQCHRLSHHNAQLLKQCFSRGELSERQSKDLSLLESGWCGLHACTGQQLGPIYFVPSTPLSRFANGVADIPIPYASVNGPVPLSQQSESR
jgi:hypothetical protein